MSILRVEGLTKFYGEKCLFQDIEFQISPGDKIALVAKNGTGKSTLLQVINGIESSDEGSVDLYQGVRMEYLDQDPELNPNLTILDEVFNTENAQLQAIKKFEAASKSGDVQALADAQSEMDSANAWEYETVVKQVLGSLNIHRLDQSISQLSGGQKKRVALAKVLISDPEFLILDEPTNHLDLDMIEWLEGLLSKKNTTIFMITHDRYFLDRVCNQIYELEDGSLHRYKGNYTHYLEKKENRVSNERSTIEKARSLMKKELEWVRRMPKARGTKNKARIQAFHELRDVAYKNTQSDSLAIQVNTPRLGSKILEINNIKKAYGDLTLINGFSYKFKKFDRVGIIGANGTGKSTFLDIITQQTSPDEGTVKVGETVQFGYFNQSGLSLDENKRVVEVVRDIGEFMPLKDGYKLSSEQLLERFLFNRKQQQVYVHKLSGGEKRRLHLLCTLMKNPNFLILDEPTNDLDILTLNVLEEFLIGFAGCLIVVSHDRYFMDKLVEHTFVFLPDGEIKDFPGNYSQFRESFVPDKKEVNDDEKESKPTTRNQNRTKKLSYKDKRRMEELETEIDGLETERATLLQAFEKGSLSNDEMSENSQRLGEIQEKLDEMEMEWMELAEKAEQP